MNTPRIQKKQRKAFALVLALALMGFMVLLTVSLATMVSMQTKLSKQAENTFKAKQAAKFSAYQAMGQIQSTLGPDQRITANAAILTDSIHSGITSLDNDSNFNWWSSPMRIRRTDADDISGSVAPNKYWVGVWNSARGLHPAKQERRESRSSYVQNVKDRAITWLVSGNEYASEANVKNGATDADIRYKPDNRLKEGEFVRVATHNSYARFDGRRDSFDDVVAPIVELEQDTDNDTIERDSGIQHRIAWWVSDEGQKASLNAIASYDFKMHARSVNKFRIQSLPFYSGVQGLTLGSTDSRLYGIELDDDGSDNSGVMIARNATTLADLDAIASAAVSPDTPPSKLLFHAATCNTKGVLVNVRDGGLKKDLSLGLIQTNAKDDEHAKTTEQEIKTMPEYFPRPYGVAGYMAKIPAYPIVFTNRSKWKHTRIENKPKLLDANENGGREFAGHIFGPQIFGTEKKVGNYEAMSGLNGSGETFWASLYDTDKSLFKDPGGALWDQLRSYYNLRSPDNPAGSVISARVQTDDRYGAKPVVKRFQIHFVPAFVNWTAQKYGLRLHIIPMLVLWNPYDTKIGEDAYYAIRVSTDDIYRYFSPIGSFRFAIGYKSGSYFQCLRDHLAERISFPNGLFPNGGLFDDDYKKRNGFLTTKFWTYGGGSMISGGNNDYISGSQQGFISQTSPFRSMNGADKTWYPLGYGTIARGTVAKNSGERNTRYFIHYAGGYGSVNYANRLEFKSFAIGSVGKEEKATEKSVNAYYFEHILNEDNMTPMVMLYSNNTDRQNLDERVSKIGRVLKVPLFLNNLYVSLCHGDYNSVADYQNDKVFCGQRLIDAYQVPTNGSQILSANSDRVATADMHFLAYDPSGIDAGATKVFAMRSPVNYFGDASKTSSNSGKNGPNGFMENNGRFPYVELKAELLPVGEGGNLGGCFYVDVPHPEMEHNAKYNSNRPQVINVVRGGSESGGSSEAHWNPQNSWDSSVTNPYILFDLQTIRDDNFTDICGNSSSALSISDLYIDMDIVPTMPFSNSGYAAAQGTMNTTMQHTPLAYGFGFATSTASATTEERQLSLSIWIYRKDGMTFEKMRPMNQNESYLGEGTGVDFVPLLAHFKGLKNFIQRKYPSFPNPTLSPRKVNQSDNNILWSNTRMPGYMAFQNNPAAGSGTGTGSLLSMDPPVNYFQRIDSRIRTDTVYRKDDSKFQAAIEALPSTAGNSGTSRNLSASDFYLKFIDNANYGDARTASNQRAAFNARFFINWLPINPRRHSANNWPWKPTSSATAASVGDFLPAAIRPLGGTTVISSGEAANNSYATKLQNVVSEYIPYGIVFGHPYADEEESDRNGVSPITNKRLFVNGSMLATYNSLDFNTREDNRKDESRYWGRNNKTAYASDFVYADDRSRAPQFGGVSEMGYKISSTSDSTAYIGLSSSSGTDVNALHHILREEEVVHNIANLAGAHLTFGEGKTESASPHESYQGYANQTSGKRAWQVSYALRSPENMTVDMAIGNSLCPNRICPEYTHQIMWLDESCIMNDANLGGASKTGVKDGKRSANGAEDKVVAYDTSWHLNDALWDEYFFSTLPYRQKEWSTNYNMGKGVATPQNPRIQYVSTQTTDDYLTVADMRYSKDPSDKQFEENAGKLWVNGPFNVNSTNIDAWKAILSTYYGQSIEGYNGGLTDNRASAPFHRWQAPLDAKNKVTSSTSISQEEAIFTGYRALSNSEIEELAASIVEHIKDRGPFYSMSDFVNRAAANYSAEERYGIRNNPDAAAVDLSTQESQVTPSVLNSMMQSGGETYRVGHSQKGVLQAAIDATSINSQLHKRYIITPDKVLNTVWKDHYQFKYFSDTRNVWENWRASIGPAATGAPAYLMQQDLLARLGSFLTVRSDTFKIRAYGEIRNPVSGVVEAKAWCEMVVQRTPEYVDNSEFGNAPADIYGREKELGYQPNMTEYNTVMNESNGGLTKLNQQLGRRFKIVSFRWLNENEI